MVATAAFMDADEWHKFGPAHMEASSVRGIPKQKPKPQEENKASLGGGGGGETPKGCKTVNTNDGRGKEPHSWAQMENMMNVLLRPRPESKDCLEKP